MNPIFKALLIFFYFLFYFLHNFWMNLIYSHDAMVQFVFELE